MALYYNDDYYDGSDSLNEFVTSDNDVCELINNLSKTELQEIECSYYKNVHHNRLCPLSDEIASTKWDILPYSLFGSFFIEMTQGINEGLIKTYDAETVVRILGETDSQFIAKHLNVIDDIRRNPSNAAMQIIETLPIKKYQIEVAKRQDGISFIEVCIPDIYDNKSIISKVMNSFGYFFSKEIEEKKFSTEDSVEWITLQYEPKYQPIVTDFICENYSYLYHLCPAKHAKKILKNGLVPKSKHASYNYPARSFLIVPNRYDERNNIVRSPSIEQMRHLSAGLNRHKEHVVNDYVNDNIWMTLQIDITKLQDNIALSYDENCYPLGLFTYDNIHPDAIEIVDVYRFLTPEKRKGKIEDVPLDSIL